MGKYWSVFKISFEAEFAYKVNFIMWRVRNVFQIFLAFFLWSTVFSEPARVVFGYDRSKILTYVFGIIILRALVLSARAADISGDISRGELSNYLVKPISYFKYWFARDISSKALNLIFAFFEFIFLFILLKPPLFFQTDPIQLLGFVISAAAAVFIYFCLLFLVSSVTFWAPELGWGSHFLVTVVIVEFLSGALFPIDILPQYIQKIVLATPFPYLLFFPVQTYLGKIDGLNLFTGLVVSALWALALWFLVRLVWNRGLKVYQAFGR